MLPGSRVPGYTTGATVSLGDEQPIATEIQFSIPLDFNGSEGIFFAPFGVQNGLARNLRDSLLTRRSSA
jgi:hypothetical protein